MRLATVARPVLAHAAAVAAGLVLCVLLSVISGMVPGAIHFEVRDTYFVVAHFHVAGLALALLLTTTVVARRFAPSLSLPLRAAWGGALLHLTIAVAAWVGTLQELASVKDGALCIQASPTSGAIGVLYIGSWALSMVLTLAGLLISLVRACRLTHVVTP